jgi:hypothetical protein
MSDYPKTLILDYCGSTFDVEYTVTEFNTHFDRDERVTVIDRYSFDVHTLGGIPFDHFTPDAQREIKEAIRADGDIRTDLEEDHEHDHWCGCNDKGKEAANV